MSYGTFDEYSSVGPLLKAVRAITSLMALIGASYICLDSCVKRSKLQKRPVVNVSRYNYISGFKIHLNYLFWIRWPGLLKSSPCSETVDRESKISVSGLVQACKIKYKYLLSLITRRSLLVDDSLANPYLFALNKINILSYELNVYT